MAGAIRDHTDLDKDLKLSLFTELVKYNSRFTAPTEAFRAFADDNGISDVPEVGEAIEDLAHFRATGELRRPETWPGD